MAYFLITMMTVLAILIYVWLIASSQHVNLYSLRNLFLTAWLYYGFAIGIDFLSGAEIPYTPNEANLMDPGTWGSIAFVMWNYVLCGIGFLITYFVMQGSQPIRPVDHRYNLRVPPSWIIVVTHILIGYLYADVFLGMGRMERFAIIHQSASHKFATILVTVAFAIDILVILTAKARQASMVAMACGMLLALLTGDRTYVLLICLCAVYHWRPALRGWKLAGLAGICVFVVFTLKTVYAVGLSWWMGDRVSIAMISDHLSLSLTRLDAGASYLISIFFTGQDSPLWLGESYFVKTVQLAWPRFLGGARVSTLGEDYIWTYHLAEAQKGGGMAFSAIAEAWLNFSYLGAVILGVFWGFVANWFDRQPRKISFYIVLMMISRLFRTDAASLFKTWVLVWGAVFLVAYLALTLYTAVTERSGLRTPLVPARRYPNRSRLLGNSLR